MASHPETDPRDQEPLVEPASNGHLPREVLPSDRELELGLVDQAAGPAAEEAEAPPAPTMSARVAEAFRRFARDADPRAIKGPKVAIVVLSMSALLGSWDEQAFGLLFPEIRREFGLDVSFLIAIGAVTGIVFRLLGLGMGYLADRVSRIWMVRIGAIISNGSGLLRGFAPGAPQLVGASVAQGLGNAIAGPASGPLLADYFPVHNRARVYAFVGAAGTVGAMVGTVVAGRLAEAVGWRITLITLGALGTAVAGLAFLLREPKRGYHDRIAMGASEEVAGREQAPITWSEAWRAAGSVKTVRRLWYATPVLSVGSAALISLMPLYFAEEFQLGPAARANIAVAGMVVGLLGLIIGGPMADRLLAYKPGRVTSWLGTLSALSAINVIVLVVSQNVWISIAFGLPLQFLRALFGPAQLTLLSMTIPARLRGLGLQTFAPWEIFGLLLQPLVIGVFMDGRTVREGLLIFTPIMLIGAVVLWSVGHAVEHDIRNALAASMADEEAARARADGRGKVVVVRDVDVHYDDVQVLFNVDFDVHEGEILALLGTNGAGKSTLLRALAGLSEPTAGAIVIDGRETTHLPPHQIASLGVAVMPGGRGVFPTLTVADNLRAAAWLAERDDGDAIAEEIEHLTDGMFPVLRDRLDQPAGAMSGGEQQMLSLAMAFLMRPRLLLIDELSLGLAPGIVRQLLDALRALRDRGTTVVVVEQSVPLALTFADRAVFMEKGEVRFSGPTEELAARPDLVRSVFLRAPGAGGGTATARRRRGSDVSEPILAVEGIEVSFGGVRALRGAGLTVAPGEIVGIIGANGAGKTTLFDVISGFVLPDAGTVRIGAIDVTAWTPDTRAAAGLARSFQDSRLFPAMTVRENILVALERHLSVRSAARAGLWLPSARRSEMRASRRAEALIEALGLGDHRDTLVGNLSTGVRRLCDLAVQLAADPDILLLDEPSSGIAQAESQELAALLERVRRDADCALLVIEHDIELIAGIADRLVAMELGSVITDGRPPDVLADERVAVAYLGAGRQELPAPPEKR